MHWQQAQGILGLDDYGTFPQERVPSKQQNPHVLDSQPGDETVMAWMLAELIFKSGLSGHNVFHLLIKGVWKDSIGAMC